MQSNFVRTAAAAARSLGTATIVQLENRVPEMDELYHSSGNVLLPRVLGAELIRYPEGEDEDGSDAASRERARLLQDEGRRPFVIPLAPGNPPYGALGYVKAGQEITSQAHDFDFVIVPSGSGLTHAGLLVGLRQAGSSARVIGSCVRRSAEPQFDRMVQVLDGLSLLRGSEPVEGECCIHLWDEALAPGYGKPGETTVEAMRMMAQREGILLDPVYSAKAFAAVPALILSGVTPKGSRVLFLHTGGLAAMFGFQKTLEKAF